MLHTLKAEPKTVHWGYFNAGIKPALRVKSGDLVEIEAVTHHAGDAQNLMMDEGIARLYRDVPESDRWPGVHLMTGPIYVEGCEPGDTLEVRYLRMEPRLAYGSNLAGAWGHLYEETGSRERVTIYHINSCSCTACAKFAYDYPGRYEVPGRIIGEDEMIKEPALEGYRIPVRPHLGTAGVAPDSMERVSTIPPGAHGGNIDNWRIGAGSIMYYPVQVKGALFSVGDPHVSQGDGEINGTAIEASLDVIMQLRVRKDFHFPFPILETGEEWIVHGFDESLDQAMKNASRNMLDFLGQTRGLSSFDAYSLLSVAADFTVTQVVDTKQGIHVRLPKVVFPD